MIMTSTMIGTLRNMPTMPQIVPQNASERMMANGLMFSVLPHQHGLEHAADREIDRGQADHDDDEWTERVELDERDESRKRNPDDRPDVRDEVQEEDQKRPGRREIDANQAHDRVAHTPVSALTPVFTEI